MKDKSCSIIIPVWNLEDWIGRTLDSVLGQTHRNIQCVCVDDGSTDGTLERLRHHAASDGRIVVLRNEKNRGDAFARNRGVEHASGDFLYFLDGDDTIRADCIETMIGMMEKNGSDIGFFNALCQQPDLSWKAANFVNRRHLEMDPARNLTVEDKKHLLFSMSTGSCFRFFRTSFYKENNIHFPAQMNRGSDRTVLWKSLIRAKSVVFTEEILYEYYYRAESLDHAKNLDVGKSSAYDAVKIIEHYCRESRLWPDLRAGCFIDRMRCLTYNYNKFDSENKSRFVSECFKRGVITHDYWDVILSDEFIALYPPGSLKNAYWNFSREVLKKAVRMAHASLQGLEQDRIDEISKRIGFEFLS